MTTDHDPQKAMANALERIISEWDSQYGRFQEALGDENPRLGFVDACVNQGRTALAAYRAQAEEPKYRPFDPTKEPIQDTDEWSTDDGKNWSTLGRFYRGHTFSKITTEGVIYRRPITPEGTR